MAFTDVAYPGDKLIDRLRKWFALPVNNLRDFFKKTAKVKTPLGKSLLVMQSLLAMRGSTFYLRRNS